jgi:hypothetical protein
MIDAATAFAALALTESNSHNAQTETLKSRLP